MEADGQTCYGGRWIDLLWRQKDRYAMETGGRTCTVDRGDKHALETREMSYFVMWFSRQTNETTRAFVNSLFVMFLCCYVCIPVCIYFLRELVSSPVSAFSVNNANVTDW
jgi:hypothetical protein